MKVTRIRLHGFKSFADAIDVPIEPGLTGVVGPNGCGKSNLVEALRFVMGESSYKAMRGGGMEDVIFSGSGGRPSRNMRRGDAVRRARRGDGQRPGAGRDRAPHRARLRLQLPHQRPRGARPRRAAPLRRRRDRRAFLRAGAPGPGRRADRRQAGEAPRHPGGRRRHLRACMPAATRRSRSSGPPSTNLGRLDDVMARDRGPARGAAPAGAAGDPLPQDFRRDPPARGDALRHPLGDGAGAPRRGARRSWPRPRLRFAAATERAGRRRTATRSRRPPAAAGSARRRLPPPGALRARCATPRTELDREEAQLQGAARRSCSRRRGQAGADLQHETEIGGDAAASAASASTPRRRRSRAETEAAAGADRAARARRPRAPPPPSPRARRNSPPRPARSPPPAPSAPRASAPCARRRRSSAGSRTSGSAAHRERDRIEAEHGGDAAVATPTRGAGRGRGARSPSARRRRRPPRRPSPPPARPSAARAAPTTRPSAPSARWRRRRARWPSCSTSERPSVSRRSIDSLEVDARLREGARRRARRRPRRLARSGGAGLLGRDRRRATAIRRFPVAPSRSPASCRGAGRT